MRDFNEFDYVIFTDGSCLVNPGGAGGYAYIKINPKTSERVGFGGGAFSTTNNRMEMMAVITALEGIEEPSALMIFTDSTYIQFAYTKGWLDYWKHNCWRTSSQKPVKNVDLWHKLDALMNKHKVHLEWVKGHNGQPENELCDTWAQSFANKYANYDKDGNVINTNHIDVEKSVFRFM